MAMAMERRGTGCALTHDDDLTSRLYSKRIFYYRKPVWAHIYRLAMAEFRQSQVFSEVPSVRVWASLSELALVVVGTLLK
jgi:hypothetical protein